MKPPPAAAGLAEKRRFLAAPAAYPHAPARVDVIETHMSCVFLTGTLAYKLKKPVRYPFLDFTTLAARRRVCLTEVRLNRRLAGDVYRRIVPLRRGREGGLTLGGDSGEIVDWLIEMEQLPAAEMLDNRIAAGRVMPAEIVDIGRILGRFYAAARPQVRGGGVYPRHLERESTVNRALLLRQGWATRTEPNAALLGRVEGLLERWAPAIHARIAAGRIVEGHGDLRPEHICLRRPIVAIDCLEFDREMRILDPYDEVNYLGLECERQGAGWIRPLLLATLEDVLGGRPEPALLHTYGAFRAVLRARICMAHLLDPEPQRPEHWPAAAQAYLALAEAECIRAGG
ncbi:hypothetical protein [Devosia sp.]|uniref:hypothetical protein n=1 Tax=Devosia sp. TaxID=1871048 RepID=UPI002EE39F1E